MQSKYLWLGFAATLMIAMACVDGGDAQPPGKKGPGKKGGFRRGVTADEIVERIMSFDKNDDGKVTKDELPERMQHLIALGDVNKDGALDKDEIRKLATTLEAFIGLTGAAGPGGGPPKGGGPKGGGFKGGGEIQRALDDLAISGKTRDNADRLLRAHLDKLRRLEEASRAELVLQMKDVLNEEDYRAFKAALDRAPGPPRFGDPKTQDLNRRVDQLQKELDDLRRKLAK